MAVASAMTPSGAQPRRQARARHAVRRRVQSAGYDVLDTNWGAANEAAAAAGRTMDRRDLRLVAPLHIAETREQAMEDVRWGWDEFKYYNKPGRARTAAACSAAPSRRWSRSTARASARRTTPWPSCSRYWDKTGGFGAMLHIAINWARFEDMKRSYELFMRYVMPKFAGYNEWRENSLDWLKDNSIAFGDKRVAAARKTIDDYFARNPQSPPKG